MSDFVDVMKKVDTICDYYNRDCHACPLFINGKFCNEAIFEMPEKVDEVVSKWQPDIYPTILEIVHHISTHLPTREDGKSWLNIPISEVLNQRLPRDIAEEWDIVPINEGGLTKYVDDEEMESEWR